MGSESCVLAYSGGLDTSAIVVWLKERGLDVHAVLVDVGQDEDLHGLCEKAMRSGAVSAVVRDAKPAMYRGVVGRAIGLAATYEGTYRLGTALARPFIAQEQVRRAREVGARSLAHGATGKGNDQIRFEFAYRSLAPDCRIIAPWKEWDLAGRKELVAYLRERGVTDDFEIEKAYSLDENLWHLSVEGGPLEDPSVRVDVTAILSAVAGRFAQGGSSSGAAPVNGSSTTVALAFQGGLPVALDGAPGDLGDIVQTLNRRYRHAPWGWDLLIENRFTGIKSRGLYINPAARLLHSAIDALARSVFHKAMYDAWIDLGRRYGELLYRGEYFSEQRIMLDAAAEPLLARLGGTVTLGLEPALHVTTIDTDRSVFRPELATFEASAFRHQDAAGFIHLSWLSSIGRPFAESHDADALETTGRTSPELLTDQQLSDRRLVSP